MNPIDLRVGYEHGAQPLGGPRLPLVKLGKVISVHREDHSVELMFLDGGPTAQVPVLTSSMGTNTGFTGLIAPSRDPKQPARKTYPQSEEAVHSEVNIGKSGRDQYAVVLQAEGSGFGTAKMYVIGFLPPQVSEMLFARHEMGADGTQAASVEQEGEFDDFQLHRHSSDLQTTLDKNGKMSMQHPNGSRITMGEDVGAVDLTKKDYDKLYELRENLDRAVSIYALAKDAAHKKRADILTAANGQIRAIVYQANEQIRADLILTDGGVLVGTVYSPNGATMAYISLTADGTLNGFGFNEVHLHDYAGDYLTLSGGTVELHAVGDMKLTAGGTISAVAHINVEVEAGANISIDAGANIDITAGGVLTEVATLIELN